MEILDLIKLIDNSTLEKIFSLFLAKNQPSSTPQNDFSSPYWQLPSYNSPPQSKPPIPSEQTTNVGEILNLIKLIIPLIQTKKTSDTFVSADVNIKSEILSLPKIDKL